jgi:hypothetical protein
MQQQAKEFIAKYSLVSVAADYPRGLNKQYEDLFNSIFGRVPDCSGCKKGRDDWQLLRNYSTTGLITTTTMSTSRFKLKESCMPYCASSHAYLMQKTLTDEAAVRFLAQSPALKKHFVELPEGWEEDVKAFQENQPKATATEITEVNVTEKTADQADQALAPEAKPAASNKNLFKKKR